MLAQCLLSFGELLNLVHQLDNFETDLMHLLAATNSQKNKSKKEKNKLNKTGKIRFRNRCAIFSFGVPSTTTANPVFLSYHVIYSLRF